LAAKTYGRVPRLVGEMGAVNRAIDGKGGLPVITNQLVGQVDNPSYLLTAPISLVVEYAGERLG
jgi:hypothetical protein